MSAGFRPTTFKFYLQLVTASDWLPYPWHVLKQQRWRDESQPPEVHSARHAEIVKMLRILETNTQQEQDVAKLLSECSSSLVLVGAVAVVPLSLLFSFLFSLSLCLL